MEMTKYDKGDDQILYEGCVYNKQKNLANGVGFHECEKCLNAAECKDRS